MSTSTFSNPIEALKRSRSSRMGGREEEEEAVMSSSPPWRYHREKLFELAPYFWGRDDHTDCTIIILHASGNETAYHLHLGYVASQSSVLLNAFLGVSTTPRISSPTSSSKTSVPQSPPPSPNFPPQGAQRVLSCDSPTLRLCLPDPTSFELILHFIYWGNASMVEGALDQGDVCSEGLIRNINALNIGYPLKAVVGKWWMKNRTSSTSTTRPSPPLRRTRLLTPPSSDYDSEPDTP